MNYEDEIYNCKKTGNTLSNDEINDDWTCKCCNHKVIISATIGKKKESFQRFYPKEISKGNFLIFPRQNSYHRVLEITYKNSHYFIALEGYGKLKYKAYSTHNCIPNMW